MKYANARVVDASSARSLKMVCMGGEKVLERNGHRSDADNKWAEFV